MSAMLSNVRTSLTFTRTYIVYTVLLIDTSSVQTQLHALDIPTIIAAFHEHWPAVEFEQEAALA